MSVVLRLDNVSLDVPIWLQPERKDCSWFGMLLTAAFYAPKRKTHRLLNGISFEAHEGDRIGILGANGAGKSTLLRILNGVYLPSSGAITVNGTRQALLKLSLGFNNEATVRENIFLRGAAMGMKVMLIRESLDQILAFSGLQEKASHRLRTLSSGQCMRLGFAISTAIQHDIMLMDEWVGTGDSEFMAKAKERLLNRIADSKILVLASHSLGLLRETCNRGLVLDRGKLFFYGDIKDAFNAYHQIVARTKYSSNQAGRSVKTIGVLDKIIFEEGRIFIKGWALHEFSATPPLLVVEIGGQRHFISDFKRKSRPDVQRHFGLSDPMCGFEMDMVSAHSNSKEVESIIHSLSVYGGGSPEHLDGPFKLTESALNGVARPG